MTTQTVNLKIVLNRGDTIPGLRQIGNESAAISQRLSRAQVQANNEITRSYDRLQIDVVAGARRTAQAREMLGIRSENIIRAEINRTREAYDQMYRSGAFNARELSRAYDSMQRKVRELNNELRTGSTLQSKMQTALTVGAAVGAGAYVVGREANKAMSFDERLALMANTAFAERNVPGRRAGMAELEAVINRSVRSGVGGGTREQAAEALDAMIARNVLGRERSMQFLPTVMRTAAGSGAQPTEIANLSSVLVGQRIVSNDAQLKTALNMITAAGQAGGFEIKDMARWLSQQLPLAQKSGLMGLDGLQKVLTMNQAAILTAGSTDEAGNNVRNLLAKLNSSDTAKDFDKQHGGNLAQFLMDQRVKGVDAVDAWMGIIDKEASSNPQMKAMLAKLKTTSDKGQQKELLDSLAAISEGTVVGKYFQDMQATGALLGLRNKPIVDQVNAAIGQNRTVDGVNDVNYALMQSTPSAQLRAAQEAKDAATKEAMDGLTPVIGKVASGFEDLATKNPLLTGTTVVATGAITAMASAAGLATIALNRTAGGGGVPGLPPGIKRPGFGTVAAYAAGAGLSYVASQDNSAAGRYGGAAINGAMFGASVGSFIPGVGTAAGAMVGGGAGLLYQYLNEPTKQQEPAKVETTVRVELADGLKATHQTSDKKGPVSAWVETGSVWGHP